MKRILITATTLALILTLLPLVRAKENVPAAQSGERTLEQSLRSDRRPKPGREPLELRVRELQQGDFVGVQGRNPA